MAATSCQTVVRHVRCQTRRVIQIAWVCLTLAAMPLSTEQSARRHVRTTEPEVQILLDKARDRSTTFRLLVAALNDSDVIVYIETSVTRADRLRGHLVNQIVVQGPHRYVRMRLNPNLAEEPKIGVIAHELQHALEIARAPEVGRSEDIDELFRRIGFTIGTLCGDCYETATAREVERTVRAELRQSDR